MQQIIFTTYDLIKALGLKGGTLKAAMKKLNMVNFDFGYPSYNKKLDNHSAVFTIGDTRTYHVRVVMAYNSIGQPTSAKWVIGSPLMRAPTMTSEDK